MGDRTYTTITITKKDFDYLLTRYHKNSKSHFIENYTLDDIEEFDTYVKFVDYDANYGRIEPLEELLVREKIEFDHEWADGGDYTAGYSYGRRNKGEYIQWELYDSEKDICDILANLLKDPKNMAKEAKKILENLEYREVTELKPIPNNTVDYLKQITE